MGFINRENHVEIAEKFNDFINDFAKKEKLSNVEVSTLLNTHLSFMIAKQTSILMKEE